MELELWDNKLKLENNEIYNYRRTSNNSNKIDWCKISFTLTSCYLYCYLTNKLKKRKGFSKHRLMYLFYNPDFDIFNPKLVIDHISRDKLDNSIENLRVGTHQENMFNLDAKGCYKKDNIWIASITFNCKSIYLGRYKTKEEAREAYLKAKNELHIISS